MADARELLDRKTLFEDAVTLAADAVRAEHSADVLDRMPNGNGAARRAEGARLRRAGDLCLLLASLGDDALDGIASGAVGRWLNDVRIAEKRRRATGGAR